MSQMHVAEIKLHRAWNEYRADCSCGRVGSYVRTAAEAKVDHRRHAQESESDGSK